MRYYIEKEYVWNQIKKPLKICTAQKPAILCSFQRIEKNTLRVVNFLIAHICYVVMLYNGEFIFNMMDFSSIYYLKIV